MGLIRIECDFVKVFRDYVNLIKPIIKQSDDFHSAYEDLE